MSILLSYSFNYLSRNITRKYHKCKLIEYEYLSNYRDRVSDLHDHRKRYYSYRNKPNNYHYFSSQEGGGTVGIAWTNTICRPDTRKCSDIRISQPNGGSKRKRCYDTTNNPKLTSMKTAITEWDENTRDPTNTAIPAERRFSTALVRKMLL